MNFGSSSEADMIREVWEGEIPPIAEKEKRGRKINLPQDEPFIQELTSNVAINIPTSN